MDSNTFVNGPRLAVQHHQGQGGAVVGNLLAHDEQTADATRTQLIETRRLVVKWENGDAAAASDAVLGIIRLYASGSLPKSGRKVAQLLGFRSENGAVRPLTIARAAMTGVTPVVTPQRRPTDPPKSIPRAVRYSTWQDAVGEQGLTACYNAARAALAKVSELPTRRKAFAKAVSSRLVGLHKLMPFGDVKFILTSLCDGRLLDTDDIGSRYTGPMADLPFARGTSWDDVLAEMIGDEADIDDGDDQK